MRTIVFGCAIVGFMATAMLSGNAAEPAGIRDPDKLVFEGTEKAAIPDIRRALRTDFNVLLAAHPDAPLTDFLRAVEATTLLGYHHSGFRDAKVAAEYDEPEDRIVVRVAEGPRHFCGDVQLSGLQQANQKPLIDTLTQPPKKLPTPWAAGRPAPFDDSTRGEIHKRLKAAFDAQGFFSARFDIQIVAEQAQPQAQLKITVHSEGPRAEIGAITISGNERDASQEILAYLDLKSAQPYDSGLAERLKARLEESGRFLGAKIDRANSVRVFDGSREIVDLSIDLRDYNRSQPLAAELSAEEQVLLKFRDWSNQWSRGETEYDLVIDGSFTAAAIAQFCADMDMPMPPVEQGQIERVDLKIILSPKQGQTLAIRLFGSDKRLLLDDVIAFSPDRLLLGSLKHNAKLDLAIAETRVTLDFKAEPIKFDKLDESERKFTLLGGATLNYRGNHEATPLTIKTHFLPAALFSFLHQDSSKCTLNDGVWTITWDGLCVRLSAIDGRPLGQHLDVVNKDDAHFKTLEFRLHSEKGALAAELHRIESRLAQAKAYPSAAAWKSVLAFALDEWVGLLTGLDESAEKKASWAAAAALISRWSPPALIDLWPDNDRKQPNDDDSWFELPWELRKWDLDDIHQLHSPGGRSLAVFGLEIYRRLAPNEGWLWPAGRDIALLLASHSQIPLASLWSRVQADELGPIGCLLVGSLSPGWRPHMADRGQNENSRDAFRKDYEQLLSADGWLSKSLVSLVDAARSLDESELQSLAALAPEGTVRESAKTILLTLKENSDEPTADTASRLLDALWTTALRDIVTAKLRKLAPASPTKAPTELSSLGRNQNDQRQKFYGPNANQGQKLTDQKLPGFDDSPLSETFRGLDRLTDELQKNSTPKSEKPAQRDDIRVSERIGSPTPGAFAPPPPGKESKSQKSWLDEPAAPRKPLSPFPSSGTEP